MRYLLMIAMLVSVWIIAPGITAQEPTPIPIVTNTPRATAPITTFSTNTPRPPTATPNPPAGFSVYALRLWSPADMVQLVEDQLTLLNETGSDDATLTVRLAINELMRRFPNALRRVDTQERLLPLMLSAPRGSVDMRPLVRRYIERLVSESAGTISAAQAATYTIGEFRVEVTPLNASPLVTTEVTLTITTPADANPDEGTPYLYQDVVLAQFADDGTLTILSASPDYPAAPFGDRERITQSIVRDFNGDGADELGIAITYRNRINDELFVYAMRGNEAFELTVPGEQMRFGTDLNWTENTIQLQERLVKPESFWGCYDEQAVSWNWRNNAFVPSVGAITSQEEGAACDLDLMGNLFAQPPGEALTSIDFAFDPANADEPLIGRVQLVTAMLQLLNGQINDAVVTATTIANSYPQDSPRAHQARELLTAIGSGQTPLAVCAAIAQLEPDVTCDVDAVLGQLLAEPFNTEELAAELAAREIPVRQLITLEEVGRRSRPAAQLDLGDGTTWVQFEESGDGLVASVIDPPTGYAPPETLPPAARLTDNLLMLLFRGDDRTRVITAIDSLEANPDIEALSLELRFVRAFAHDLAGNREIAREQYLNLWQSDPDGVWGQFALRHLERR